MYGLVEDNPYVENTGGEADEVPLSYGQRALWFLDRLAPGSPAYVIAGAARSRVPISAAALRQAGLALVARHPALRATFHPDPAGPRQRIGEEIGRAHV